MLLNYFSTVNVIDIHKKVLYYSGGLNGVKNEGALDSIIYHIQNDEYYPTLVCKITHLMYAIIKFHPFNDGNKRTSLAIGVYFLEINGLDLIVDKFMSEMENIVVSVADNRISKELLREIIDSLLYEDCYSEELKLKIISSFGDI